MESITNLIMWLFKTRQGVLALLVGGVLLFLVIAFVLERRGKKMYYDHEQSDYEDGWGLFGK